MKFNYTIVYLNILIIVDFSRKKFESKIISYLFLLTMYYLLYSLQENDAESNLSHKIQTDKVYLIEVQT